MEEWAEYLGQLDKEKKEAVLTVMNKAYTLIPEPRRVMSYGVPTIKSADRAIIAVGANKNHFSVYPFGGAAIEANRDLLQGIDYSKGTIRFSYDSLPGDEILEAIIRFKLKSH